MLNKKCCYSQGPPQQFAPQGWGGGYQPWHNQQHPTDPSKNYYLHNFSVDIYINESRLHNADF